MKTDPSGEIRKLGTTPPESESISTEKKDQPTATELAHLAVALARTHNESVTPGNRYWLLRDAYDLWCNAEQVIQTRQEAYATPDSKSWSDPEIIAAFSDDCIAFKEIAEKRLAKKAIGAKGNPGETLGVKGIEKSLKIFFKETTQVPTAWSPTTRAKFGSVKFGEASKKQLSAASIQYLADILREKKIPKSLLQAWLDWRKPR